MKGAIWGRSCDSRFLLQAKPSFSKEGLGGLSISLRKIRSKKRQKKDSLIGCLSFFWSGKRESVHLLPTLYIKQLPLPSTIHPIRGTLGLFQGVVFESDFCHTNFRTTVAYDKFTNNFLIDKIEERWPLFVATSLRLTEHLHSPSLCYFACGRLGFAASPHYSWLCEHAGIA